MVRRKRVRHKYVRVDRVKLEKARRLLDAATDTEALDRALALVVSEGELDETLRSIGGKGSLKNVFRRETPIVLAETGIRKGVRQTATGAGDTLPSRFPEVLI